MSMNTTDVTEAESHIYKCNGSAVIFTVLLESLQ